MKSAKKPYIIVGAGLAGLACARYLASKRLPYLLLEQKPYIGGRIQTEQVGPYRLDVGFQVLLNSYPEVSKLIDIKKLNMRFFNSGCYIYTPQKMQHLANPLLHPSQLLNETLSSFVDIKDKTGVISLILQSHLARAGNSQQNSLDFLRAKGFSEHFIEMFWKPFFAGVFLDDKLSVSSDFFMFLMKCFSSGMVGVPAAGMSALPNEIAKELDQNSIILNSDISSIESAAVILASGEVLRAKNVLVASPLRNESKDFYGVRNLYFTTQEKINWGKWLVVVPPKLGLSINNIALMSEVASEYISAAPNETLISVSVLESKFKNIETVVDELRIITHLPLSDLKLVKMYDVKKALPKKFGSKEGFVEQNGAYYFGDWAATPSINGALESGRKMAEFLISNH